MANFDDLNLNKALLSALDDLEYFQPSPIQQQSVPVIMSGRDMVGIAQTGTGKTFAYLLPILRQLKYSEQKHPRVLILVPTRELVVQVVNEIKSLTKYASVRFGGIYGGGNINVQKAMVFAGLDILVSTPGRLIDLASIGAIRLKNIQQLVLDEVDEMLAQGFRTQLSMVFDHLPHKRQNILFSATLTKDIEALFADFFANPVKVQIAAHGTPLEKIVQEAYPVPNYNTKANLIAELLRTDENFSKVLVFVNKIKTADRLFELMNPLFPGMFGIIHSRKTQPHRLAALQSFENNETRVLIATDIAARGLDIADVTHVVNFDTPEIPADYLHRIGRTGRAGKDGVALTFFNEVEEDGVVEIEELMKRKIKRLPFPKQVEVSKVFADDERLRTLGKNKVIAKPGKNKTVEALPKGFHEKKEKNKKVNLGGPSKTKRKTKPSNRSAQKRKFR
jgi:ATP-dependent RNA helicase RhlE